MNIRREKGNLSARLRAAREDLKRELRVYRLLLRHRDTPRLAKMVLGVAVGYVLLPFDLIPDFVPVVGQLDDLVIVPALVLLALKLIPKSVIEECRAQVHAMETSGGRSLEPSDPKR